MTSHRCEMGKGRRYEISIRWHRSYDDVVSWVVSIKIGFFYYFYFHPQKDNCIHTPSGKKAFFGLFFRCPCLNIEILWILQFYSLILSICYISYCANCDFILLIHPFLFLCLSVSRSMMKNIKKKSFMRLSTVLKIKIKIKVKSLW